MPNKPLAHSKLVSTRVASWRETVTCVCGDLSASDDVMLMVTMWPCKLMAAKILCEATNATLGTAQIFSAAVALTDALDLDAIGAKGVKSFVLASTNVELAKGVSVWLDYNEDTNDIDGTAITMEFER
ncbi:MAG: hypothetical protein ACYSWU_29715, partial [Planctomycetota bacterium]